MSPTIMLIGKFRFFFNSREEIRRHIHVSTTNGTAKIWLEPEVSLADFYHISTGELKEIIQIVEEKRDDFINSWNRHFSQ